MIDSKIQRTYQNPFPVSFKVIGVGSKTSDIIEKVKSFGYDCIVCSIANSPSDCIPMDDDLMAIIVAVDNEVVANEIAKTYHDAGVLTIGLVNNADFSCYNNIVADTPAENFSDTIKHLLLPLVTQGFICYNFNDLCTTLRNCRFFRTFIAEGKSVDEAVTNMKKEMGYVAFQNIESLSAHLFFNSKKKPTIKTEDISHLSDMISKLSEAIDVIWSVNFDDILPDDIIKFTIIIAGKGL